jgi:multiple antibiotic resistance protein
MKALIGHSLTVFMGFFAIMNPIANTPIFLSLTADDSAASLFAAFLLGGVFCLLGKLIFNLFGITLPAFRVMGGILVALIGYQMLLDGIFGASAAANVTGT